MKKEQKNMDKAQKLMLLQGIDLIHGGLQFIEWAEEMPNELSYDFIEIIRERFQMFRESVLDGSMDNLIIDRIKKRMENVKHGYELNREIQKQLKQLREYAMSKAHQKEKDG